MNLGDANSLRMTWKMRMKNALTNALGHFFSFQG